MTPSSHPRIHVISFISLSNMPLWQLQFSFLDFCVLSLFCLGILSVLCAVCLYYIVLFEWVSSFWIVNVKITMCSGSSEDIAQKEDDIVIGDCPIFLPGLAHSCTLAINVTFTLVLLFPSCSRSEESASLSHVSWPTWTHPLTQGSLNQSIGRSNDSLQMVPSQQNRRQATPRHQ